MSVYEVNSEADADRLFGKWSDFGMRCKGALREAERNSAITVFTAGICSRCKDPCAAQMVRMDTSAPEKAEALCSTCVMRDKEARRVDWFASEERASR